MVEVLDCGRDAAAPLPQAGGVGGGPEALGRPTPLRLASELASLAAPPACGRGGGL
ncbi:conserved protein of unknown function [uncultured Sphingopyxis sp.]|uniref:Uncharacterized protein n=1 Tax=uncultured Sphingopyxis sp. TaxID=310581 RepID=A0A1Y5PVF4_9SPHN|nr:conserved protein of unknown function [uncultured Sphingopyxis sp.]